MGFCRSEAEAKFSFSAAIAIGVLVVSILWLAGNICFWPIVPISVTWNRSPDLAVKGAKMP
jgi:hypothetical protein